MSDSWSETEKDLMMHSNDGEKALIKQKKKQLEKKRIGVSGKGHPAVKVTKKTVKKTARKRVSGK